MNSTHGEPETAEIRCSICNDPMKFIDNRLHHKWPHKHYPILFLGPEARCSICGDPIKHKKNKIYHTWQHDHWPRVKAGNIRKEEIKKKAKKENKRTYLSRIKKEIKKIFITQHIHMGDNVNTSNSINNSISDSVVQRSNLGVTPKENKDEQ